MKKQMIAEKPFRYANRALGIGDPFTANSRDARILVAIGKAREGVPAPKNAPAYGEPQIVEPVTVVEPAKEPATVSESVEDSATPAESADDLLGETPEVVAPVVRTRRPYRRRSTVASEPASDE